MIVIRVPLFSPDCSDIPFRHPPVLSGSPHAYMPFTDEVEEVEHARLVDCLGYSHGFIFRYNGKDGFISD